jgi:hypothetical protein
LFGLVGACSLVKSLSCMRAVHAFAFPFGESFSFLETFLLSSTAGWMSVGPGCLLVLVSY